MPIADPTEIPGLILWYSAEYEATQYADAAGITVLHDLSGNGLNAPATATPPIMRHSGGQGGGAYLDAGVHGVGWLIPDVSGMVNATDGVHSFLDIYANLNGRGPFKAWSSDQYYTFDDGHVYSDFFRSDRVGPINVVALGKPVVTTWRRLQQFSKTGSWKLLLDETSMVSTTGTFQETTDIGGNLIHFGTWPNAGNPNGYRFGGLCWFDHELVGDELTDFLAWKMANLNGGTPLVSPDDPTGLNVDNETATSFDFNWVAPSGVVDGYEIQLDGAGTLDVGLVLTHPFTGLTPSTSYEPGVRAYNEAGASSWVTTTGETTAVAPPTSLAVTPTITTLVLSFDASIDDVDGYEVRADVGAPIDIGTDLSYEFEGLEPDVDHNLEARAYIGGSFSSWVGLSGETEGFDPLVFDAVDDRLYHTGIDRGVLYSSVSDPVVWNGLTGVDENNDSSSTMYYIDGKIYLADVDPGDFSGTLSSYFWPEAFAECIGIPKIADGFYADNQKPKRFGLCYRSLIGSGLAGDMFGYQLHLLYNVMATIGTRSRKTINETPTPMEFTFDLVATPVVLPGIRPTAHFIIDTRTLSPEVLSQLEDILYGTPLALPRLPTPEDLYELLNFGSGITFIDHGDGTWTARGSASNVHMTGPDTWEILNVNGTDNGDGTYELEDTP